MLHPEDVTDFTRRRGGVDVARQQAVSRRGSSSYAGMSPRQLQICRVPLVEKQHLVGVVMPASLCGLCCQSIGTVHFHGSSAVRPLMCKQVAVASCSLLFAVVAVRPAYLLPACEVRAHKQSFVTRLPRVTCSSPTSPEIPVVDPMAGTERNEFRPVLHDHEQVTGSR